MGAALLIYFYITDELSYDRYHSKIDRTYRITREFLNNDGAVVGHFSAIAPAFGPALENDFGQIEAMTRTFSVLDFDMAVEENGERRRAAHEENVFLAEPDVFRIFDIPVLSGWLTKCPIEYVLIGIVPGAVHVYRNYRIIVLAAMTVGIASSRNVITADYRFGTRM